MTYLYVNMFVKLEVAVVTRDVVVRIAEKQRTLSERVIKTKDKDIGDGR